MKAPITIQIIVKNHESVIEHCLQSISSLNANILIGDIGCEDNSIKISKQFTNNIKRLYIKDDMSKARNEMMHLSSTKWNFYIDPWETFLSGDINEIFEKTNNCFKINVLQSDVLTKQIRIWNKDSGIFFKNPIYEYLDGDAINLPVYIKSEAYKNDLEKQILESWQKSFPFSSETIYYTACFNFKEKNWDSFLNYSESYLHQEKTKKKSYFMMLYYRSMVLCYMKKDFENAVKSLIPCLAEKPTNGEFWCLLGDIYYCLKDYERAKSFYENAKILGSRRLNDDDYPMEISKYKEYPEKLIKSCDAIKQSCSIYSGKVHSRLISE